MQKLDKIKNDLKQILTEKRYTHSVNVMEKCVELAKKYNEDIEKASLVGIAHDIAKEMSIDDMFKYTKSNNIEVDEVEKSSPTLLHAKIGADICTKKYGFSEDMAKAIRAHTTGQAHMSKLAKILYISDAISKEREGDYVETARKLVETSLDKTVLYLLETFIKDCEDRNKLVHPDALVAVSELKANEIDR